MALFGAFSTAAWALSEVGGVYQIGTAADLVAFAELVNGGEIYANAVLTADIDKGADGTMIGTAENKYSGTFDGAGHTITINMFSESSADLALFHYTGFGAIIQNLKVTGEMTTNQKFAAGIVARNYGTIRGCYVDVVINSMVAGDATHGGIVAVGYGGTLVENCLAKITILGEATENCGGVVGWAEKRSNIVNCLAITDGSTLNVSNGLSANIARNGGNLKTIDVETYNADPYANRPQGASFNNYVTQQWGDNVATTVVPLEDLADGRICYQLNNDQSRIAWVQTIGTDEFPVPAAFGSGRVYASVSTACDGLTEDAATYSNSGSDLAAKHQFDKYGVCTVCGCFDFHYFEDANKFDPVDRAVVFETTADIDKAEGWNRIANGFRLNMKLANDIEYIAEPGKYIFNSSDWIDGNFNGQGHAFTIGLSDVPGYAGLFPEMAGNIENLILHGTIETTGARVGSLCAEARMALVRNVYSDVDITSSLAGDNTSGGFFGWTGDVEKHVENCIYAGTFTLPGADEGARCARVGGFSGWAATKTYFTNCAMLGNIIGAGDQTLDNDTENSGNISRNYGNVVSENVYVVNPISGNSITDSDKYIHYTNTEGIANGELAFLLNSNKNGLDRFYQLIGTDPEPMPIAKEGALVYSIAAEYRCDGKPLGEVTYTNTETTPSIPDHTWNDVDGIDCSVCGSLNEDYMTPVDGWYEISNATKLIWWSFYANKYPDVKGRLTANINMDGKMTRFTPIGSQANLFVGEFDGQGHKFSKFNYSGGSYSGLFGVIGSGAVIKNFVLDSTCSISGGAYCGIIGGTNGGGDVYLTNLGNEGVVTGGQNTSGILGVDMGGAATLHITNCYVTGAIKGANESAKNITFDNSFTRGQTSVVNCYEIEGVGTQNTTNNDKDRTNLITAEEVANGALCFKLNTPDFGQTIGTDTHPIFGGKKVYLFAGEYSNLDGINIETATGGADCILPAKKYGGDYSAYTWLANADFDYGEWNTGNPNYNVIIGVPAENNGKAWFAPGFSVDGWNYGQDLPKFGDGRPADVYAVRYFTVDGEIPSTLYMPAPHDDAPCEYYINGELIWSETDGWYEDEVVRLTDEQKALIKTDGKTINVFAFHVHQNWGGRYADGGLYTAGAPVDAFNNDGNKKAIDATIAIMEAQGIGAEAIEYASNINYRNGFAKGLAQLRKARRLAFDARTENFVGTEPADGLTAYLLNVGAKMFLAGGNNWGTHASLNHMGAKCILLANSSGANRYSIKTNLPNGSRSDYDGLGHNGYVDCGPYNYDDFISNEGWAWEFEALADGTYHIINASNSGANIYLGMTDSDLLEVNTDRAGADDPFNKWIIVTPEEFLALAEQATAENPVDLGHLVHQATFSQNDFDCDDKGLADFGNDKNTESWQYSGWDTNAGWIWNWKGNSAGGDYVFEMWNTKDKGYVYLVQEVEGLPAGKYTVQMNGYYRDGNFESADEGNVRKLAYLFAGSEENCVPLQSIVEGSGNYPGLGRGGASGIVIPDGCDVAAKFFQVGTYVNTIDAEVGADGKLRIGIYRNEGDDVKGGDWITSDNWRLFYKGNPVEVEISESGYATFVAPGNINIIPDAVEVFAAQKVEDKGYVHLEPVAAIPTGEAVVLKGAEGTYTMYANASSAELGTTNDLIPVTGEVVADGTQYVIGQPDGEEVGFWQATPGTTITLGKGYLVFTTGVKPFYPFNDENATGIANIVDALENGAIYNVAGQRLGKMQKGINIVNGKKVLR